METWKNVVGFDNYEVSDNGRDSFIDAERVSDLRLAGNTWPSIASHLGNTVGGVRKALIRAGEYFGHR